MARKYGKKTSEKVARTMREFKEGKLRSGSGGKVTSREQAIAIGLSQARAKGYKVPSAPAHSTMLRGVPLLRVESVTLPTGLKAEIHIHHGKGGYAGVLVYPNGNELPLSLGVPEPKTAAAALRGARQFLTRVWGKTSPSAKASTSHATKASASSRPTPYRIKLTPSEMSAVEFARGRYEWPDMLAAHVAEDGSIAFTESEMWQWVDDVDSDAEGGHSPFPLASRSLASKLQDFRDSVV